MEVLIKEDYKILNGMKMHLELIYYHRYVCTKDGFYIKASTGRDYIARQEIYILPASRMTRKAKGTAYRIYCDFVDNIENNLDKLQPVFANAARLDMLDKQYSEKRAASMS